MLMKLLSGGPDPRNEEEGGKTKRGAEGKTKDTNALILNARRPLTEMGYSAGRNETVGRGTEPDNWHIS